MGRAALLLTILLAVAVVSQMARGDDPPATPLATAKAAQRTALDKARQRLVGQFEVVIQNVAKSGDLEAVRAIREEKAEFEADETLPTSTRMRSAVSEYQLAVRQASTSLAKAYEEAIREATKALKIDQAEQLDKELKELRATIADRSKTGSNRSSASGLQYSFHEWQKGDPPLKLIHSQDGFCYLSGITGALLGGGASATDQPLTARIVAVKVPKRGL